MSCLPNRAPQVTSTNLWTWMRPDQPQIQEYSTFPTTPVDKMFIKHTGYTPNRFFQYDNSLTQYPPDQRWVEVSAYTGGFQVPLIPTGANPLQITDTTEGHASNPASAHNGIEGSIFIVYINDPDPKVAGPMLMTDRGLIVKKDLMAGGFLDSGQGTLWLNYGLVGKPELASPPVIQLMSASTPYPSGIQFRDISPDWYEEGQLFTLTSDYYWPRKSKTYPAGKYRWEGNGQNGDWIKSDSYTGNYDTLYLCKDHFTMPAHLDLGNLTAHGTVTFRGASNATGARLWSDQSETFKLMTETSTTSPNWTIAFGNGSGGVNTNLPYISASSGGIGFYPGNPATTVTIGGPLYATEVKSSVYHDDTGGSNATFCGNVTGTAAKLRILSTNPSPADGEIWLVS